MVIGDQQFVTLLFYLDDICIFTNSADQMLDRIELAFSRLKQYQLKIKPKKSFFFQTEVSFLGHVLSAKGISPNPEKVDKVRDWPVPKTSKEVHSRPEVEGENHNQTGSDNDDEEWQAISYSTICEELEGVLGGVKVGRALKERIQVVQSAEDDIYGSCKIEVITGMVDVFHQVPSTTMAEHQAKDNQLAPVLEWVREGKSPTKATIYQVRSKNTRQLIYQFHRLILKDGVLHRLYIHNDVEYHQLVLPQRYHKKVLQSLHNNLGHQGIDRTLDLLRERVYWPTMTQDANL